VGATLGGSHESLEGTASRMEIFCGLRLEVRVYADQGRPSPIRRLGVVSQGGRHLDLQDRTEFLLLGEDGSHAGLLAVPVVIRPGRCWQWRGMCLAVSHHQSNVTVCWVVSGLHSLVLRSCDVPRQHRISCSMHQPWNRLKEYVDPMREVWLRGPGQTRPTPLRG
jgi:hypothetical protein